MPMPGGLPSMHSMLPAMIVLIVPSFLVCAVIATAAYRRRDKSAGE
jgi:hypothetical protein